MSCIPAAHRHDCFGYRTLVRQALPIDAPGIARVQVETWRTTYHGILPADHLAQLSYEQAERRWVRILGAANTRSSTYIAEDDRGMITGFASGGSNRTQDPLYRAELYAIYVLATHQGHGIGRQLTAALVRYFAQAGLYSMLVWVLADNPFRRFYAKLGGLPVYEERVTVGGIEVVEVAYGWLDAAMILPITRS